MPTRPWTFAVAWMAVILALSTETFSFCNTLSVLEAVMVRVVPAEAATDSARMNAGARTGVHVLEYAVLAILLVRALTIGRRRARHAVALTLVACVAWAVVDEGHQAREPTRQGTIADVALDAAGAVLGVGIWLGVARRREANGRDAAPSRRSAA